MKKLILFLVAIVLFVSCDEQLTGTDGLCTTEITIERPADMPEGVITEEEYTFKNVTTGIVYRQSHPQAHLVPGLYDISYEATLRLPDQSVYRLRAFIQSCVLTVGANTVALSASCVIDNNDLIISEIFFTGTLQSSGNSYNGDDYVKLYNNTDHVIYADGLTLFESKFTTTEKNNYSPDIMAEAMYNPQNEMFEPFGTKCCSRQNETYNLRAFFHSPTGRRL